MTQKQLRLLLIACLNQNQFRSDEHVKPSLFPKPDNVCPKYYAAFEELIGQVIAGKTDKTARYKPLEAG